MATIKKIPAIRFKGFEEEWEKKKLEEIIDLNSGRDYKHLSPGNIPVYGTGGYMLSVNEALSYKENAVGIGRKGTIDKPYILCAPFWTVDTLFFALPKPNNDLDFIYSIFQRINWKQKDESTGVPSLSKISINNTDINVAPDAEQIHIGNYFKELDGLIQLQEQRLEKIANLKKAMLEKMFPAANADVPEVRFKGFTDKWEKKRLGKVFDFNIPTNTLSRAFLNDKNGAIKNIHYGDILIKYKSCLNVDEESIPYITNRNINDFKNSYLKEGDIIFADAAEDETVGKAIEIYNVNDNYLIAGLHTIATRPLFKFERYYLGYYLNSKAYHHQLISLMQGTKVLSISKTNLKKTILAYPTNQKEQKKIGEYFQNLDQIINQSQQKIEQLKHLKQALLQKMFI